MKVICTTCKYEYDADKSQRCPRCGTAAPRKTGCESCAGCSFWRSCKPGSKQMA